MKEIETDWDEFWKLWKEEGNKRAAMTPEELKKYDASIEAPDILAMPSDGILGTEDNPVTKTK